MVGISSTKVNHILDADIRSFFDAVSQTWLMRFLEHRIGDRRIVRLTRDSAPPRERRRRPHLRRAPRGARVLSELRPVAALVRAVLRESQKPLT